MLLADDRKPEWMRIAEAELGVHETPGPQATQRIIEYDSATSLKATSDEVPWCAAFVNWVLRGCGIPGTNSAAAKSFANWGEHCDGSQIGAVVVIQQRTAGQDPATGSGSGYHVAFLAAPLQGDHVQLLGGNQHDSVKISSFPLAHYAIVATRWPSGVMRS